jgi:hypothetical protein
MTAKLSESDLAEPLCAYLAAQGYTVRSEVKDCDLAAVRGEDLVIIELKKSLNLALLIQAARRQRITDSVYAAIPRPSNRWKWNAQNRGVLHLLRRLSIGLILISLDPGKPPVEVVFQPLPFTRRKRATSRRALLEEIHNRTGDYNRAGSSRRKLVTAYRENAIHIACRLFVGGSLSPKTLRSMGTGPKTLSILSGNVYGWFERMERGVYALSAIGRKELDEFPRLMERYLPSSPKKSDRKKRGSLK